MLWDTGIGQGRVVADNMLDMVFAPTSHELAISRIDRTIAIVPVAGGEPRIITEHTDMVWSVAYLDDGRLASASHDRTVRLWDTATGRSRALYGHDYGVHTLAVVPSRRVLVSGSLDGIIRIWPVDAEPIADAAALRAALEQRTTAVVTPSGHLATPGHPSGDASGRASGRASGHASGHALGPPAEQDASGR